MGMMREHVRLGAKLGPDHPRVVALAEKIRRGKNARPETGA